MSRGKQPYIPLYIGDWIQDTDCLSIDAEGAWLRVVFKCWKNNGVFSATLEVFARVCKVDTQKFASILLEWKTNDICDIVHGDNGIVTVMSRRIRRDKEISAIRSETGSKGGSKTQAKGKANSQAKTKQNTDNDIDNENDTNVFKNELKSVEKKVENLEVVIDDPLIVTCKDGDIRESDFKYMFSEDMIQARERIYKGVDIPDQLEKFKLKVRAAPSYYQSHTGDGLKMAFDRHLQNAPKKPKNNVAIKKFTSQELDS